MRLQREGLATIIATQLLHKQFGKAIAQLGYNEVGDLVERLLYNAYVEGYNASSCQVSELAMDLTSKGACIKSEHDMLTCQSENNLWREE